jgi:Flp pilus assembly pilin Flp
VAGAAAVLQIERFLDNSVPRTPNRGASEQRKEVSKLLRTYVALKNTWYRLHRGQEGQTMAEYGVILAVITIGILAALGFLSGEIQNALKAVANRLDGTEG